jgi:hypothetical protein
MMMNKEENKFTFNSKISGSTFTEGAQEAIAKLKEDEVLKLVREPNNKYDANAIAIYKGKKQLGYLPASTAAKLFKDVDNSKVTCKVAQVTGGKEGQSYGCNIELEVTREEEKNDKEE